MDYFTGNHLRELLIRKGYSFRDSSRALNLTADEMNALLRSSKIEHAFFIDINEKLKLGIDMKPSPPDYVDPRDKELNILRNRVEILKTLVVKSVPDLLTKNLSINEAISRYTELLNGVLKKLDKEE